MSKSKATPEPEALKSSSESPKKIKIRLPKVHPGQMEVLSHPARFKVVNCGRRWGKTRLGVVAALLVALSGMRAWWVAPTYSISAIAYRLAVHMAKKIPGVTIKKSERVINFPSGGEIWFKSSDNRDNLRGEGLDWLFMDEAAYQSEETWTAVLRPALSDRKGSCMMISSPAEETGWYRDCFNKGQNEEETSWHSWMFPSLSNPFLDPAEIEDAKKDLPAIIYRREYGAEFVSAAGAQILREWLRYGEPTRDMTTDRYHLTKIAVGIDLAISEKTSADYTAAVVLGRNAEGKHWVMDVQRGRMSFNKIIDFIKRIAAKWNPDVIGIETNQFQTAVVQELLRTTDLNVHGFHSDTDKVTRAQPVVARYEQALIEHFPRLIGEFEYELLVFPAGEHDDMVDALTVAYRALNKRLNPKPADKPRKPGRLPKKPMKKQLLRKAA